MRVNVNRSGLVEEVIVVHVVLLEPLGLLVDHLRVSLLTTVVLRRVILDLFLSRCSVCFGELLWVLICDLDELNCWLWDWLLLVLCTHLLLVDC